MSVQSELLGGITINADLVNAIDRHIKEVESQLNERLVHVSANFIAANFLPEIKRQQYATKVDDAVWESLFFAKNWYRQTGYHEELSFGKCQKGYGFLYTSGDVLFDLGVCEDLDGIDWYVRVIEDRRESHKLTGAPVEIKLRAFQHLTPLLRKIAAQSEGMNLVIPR